MTLCKWKLLHFKTVLGTSLAVQWLRLCTSIAGGAGLFPGWRTKILHASRCGQKKKKRRRICVLAKRWEVSVTTEPGKGAHSPFLFAWVSVNMVLCKAKTACILSFKKKPTLLFQAYPQYLKTSPLHALLGMFDPGHLNVWDVEWVFSSREKFTEVED